MPKIHITSLLRPRAAIYHKSHSTTSEAVSTQQHQCTDASNHQHTASANIVVYSATAAIDELPPPDIGPHLVYADESTSAINNIELIPTLEFVSQTPQTSYEHLQQCLGTCCGGNHENTPPPHQQHESATSSLLTYTVESPQTIESAAAAASPYNKTKDNTEESQQQESSSSVDTTDLLLQQVATVSLTDSATSIYFDEPTSSISIEMMEDSQRTTPATTTTNEGATTRSGTSTTDHLPASSTNTRSNTTSITSHSYVPQSLTNVPLSSLSDEQDEIEEEIEEALELSEDQSLDFEEAAAAGPSKKLSAKPEQLFGIEFSDISSNENSLALPDTGRSKQLSSNDDERLYQIDDDQLSGGKLAQHFVVNEDEDDSEVLSLSVPRATPQLQSLPADTEDSLELPQQQPKVKPQSSCNQSTSDDVSELQDEPIEAEDSLLSELGYVSKEEDQMSLQHSIDKESQQEESSLEPFPSIPLLDIPQAAESEGEKPKGAQERVKTSSGLQETLQVTKEAIGLTSLLQENAAEKSLRVAEEHQDKLFLEKPITAIELSSLSKDMSPRVAEDNQKELELSLQRQTTAIGLISTSQEITTEKSPRVAEGKVFSLVKPITIEASKPTDYSTNEGQLSNSSINQARNTGPIPAATTTEKTLRMGEEETERESSVKNPITAIELSSLAKENATAKSLRVAESTNEKESSLEKSITAIQLNSPREAEEHQKESSSEKQTTVQNVDQIHENLKLDSHSKSPNLERGKSYASSTSQPTVQQISTHETAENSNESKATTKTSMTEFSQEDTAKDLEKSPGTTGTKAAANPFSLLEILENPVRTPTVLLLAPLKKPMLPEFFENPNIKPLSGASSLHSEKDEQQSIEELLSLNSNSMEMTLEDHNVTSLNHSYIDKNQTLINELLKDSPKGQSGQQEAENQHKTLNKYSGHQNSTAAASLHSNATGANLLGLNLTPHLQYATEYVEKTDFLQMESCGDLVGKPLLHSEIITDLDDSLQEDLPKTADSRPTQPLHNLRIDTGMEDQIEDEDEEEEDTSLQLMKLRIMAMKHHQPKEQQLSPNGDVGTTTITTNTLTQDAANQAAKPMERVSLVDFAKDVLEDITEESERNSLSTQEEQNSLNIDKSSTGRLNPSLALEAKDNNESMNSNSIVSLNMIQMLEKKLSELQQMLATKDACLASLNLQLENMQQRRGSSELMGSGRESSSLVTNSTEYRTLQEDFGQTTLDIYLELNKRDELIAKLTDSLQQSLVIRENLQSESEKLGTEVQLLRKQLTDAMETFKRPYWPPRADQESQFGQRISEISMDLVSESDDDYERHYFTDTEEKFSRNSRERQLSMPRQFDYAPVSEAELLSDTTPFSKQIEQFQKYLTPSEVRLFFMVQKKFDDYLCQELEKCKMKSEQELKLVLDQWDTEKREKAVEIERLLSQRQEREAKHNQEMENLRKYFETKCADLEKQFSDDVFSQQSQRQGMSSTESSDQEQMPDDIYKSPSLPRSKEASPRKRTRAELLLSPSHRQMTPGNEVFLEEATAHEGSQLALEITELKRFYQNKIHEIQRSQEDNLKKLNDRLKYYESRYPEDEFVSSTKNSTLNSTCASSVNTEDITQLTVRSVNALEDVITKANQDEAIAIAETISSPLIGQSNNNNNNTSLIIIDTDELTSTQNETQIIQKIIDEYERRLQEQLALAREDIVHELEQQIQTLLSETTADDQHWPKELILLREKFTAKSQLEIAQLQIKHAEEMSRLKQDFEKQLNRKNKRHSTFDSVRDFDKLLSERDNLRELSKTFRQVLSELLECVANCENDISDTLMEEIQRLLSCNRTLEEHSLDDYSFNATLLNDTLSTTKMRLIPDVHNLREVIEDPDLVQYISQRTSDYAEDFDLKVCMERLRSEASFLLHLSEDLSKKRHHHADSDHGRRDSYSSGVEKNDSCCEQEDDLKLQQNRKFIRVNSLNEQELSTYRPALITQMPNLTSLPPDLNRVVYQDSVTTFSDNGKNASELNFQVTELKNRLVKSENERLQLREELERTKSRHLELGQELDQLKDQLSQLPSLNSIQYNEGYGLGASMKSPQGLSTLEDHNSTGFAQLQEKARNILSTPTQKQHSNDTTAQLLQMIEDFCRESDKVVECCKKDREDLQSQIDTADKQLKATRQFLEEQAIEREQEREEFLKEVGNLKAQLRDKEKELSSYANTSEEVEHLESQIRDITQKLQESNAKRDHFEVELKAYLDKTYVLREIITDLENQISTKAVNEQVMEEKLKHLEEYINSQNHCNEELQMEIQTLKSEIEHGYQVRIKQLEEKLQNIRPPAEQSIIMDQVVEQLKDIENTLEQKTKNLESLHQSTSSSVGSLSCPEDVSARGPGPTSLGASIVTPTQGSPIHPSPRQHSLTMEGVQRVVEKLSKHSRIEEAAVKRIRDLEMQVTQMRTACVELQYERESLQERMSEQTQRISALQSRLEEQRQRAEELQRGNTSDLNIRIHDLQNELQTVRETLSNRDKQIATMKQQLEKSKMAIDRLEAEVAVEHQPDRSIIERMDAELQQKQAENQKLKDKIKNEMINKLALPDLMETMLADKNEEIDHLKEQLEGKEKELQSAMEVSQNTTCAGERKPGFFSTKLSGGGTFSEIASISELDEPEVVRRTAAVACSPLLLPQGSEGYLHNTIDTSKGAVANLTHKRTEDLSGFTTIQQANTFDRPHYFQDPNILLGSDQSGASVNPSPLVPRQINFSDLTEDSKFKSSLVYKTPENSKQTENDKESIEILERQVTELKQQLEEQQQQEMSKIKQLQEQISQKTLEIERLTQEQDKWQREKAELLSKHEKNMKNLQESEELYKKRMHDLEEKLLKSTETEVNERESLRKELRAISEVHEQCKYTAKDNESRKREIENLNQEIKTKDERLLTLSTKLSIAEDNIADLQRQIVILEREVEKCKQQSSDNSSRQFSVDEVAQQIEKELNYSAQLDSNILKAIESEEENNLDRSHAHKNMIAEHPGTTDDENFVGERDLLNQLEALRAQIIVEREHAEEIRQELLQEKHHSQEVQEQDVVIIEAMRKRLEAAMDQEEELHKQLDIERERCERLQTQISTLQRTESRRNSSLLKSPVESPRKSPRSLMTDFESELAERLRSEIKLLTAQNERERERSADLQRNGERERSRYEKELVERIDYCDKLKREMEKVSRDKDNAEMEAEHLQERLMLQTQEIESLEARIASLQEAETRRCTRKEKHQKENVQLMAELQELKTQLFTLQSEKDVMHKNITQLRFDIERSAQREGKLAEALANANSQLAAREGTTTVPEQFLQKMKEINNLLAENTQENKQMAETVQYLVEERLQLQRKCEDLESQLSGTANVSELEERCNHLLGRYLRVESHRKALVYQKRYLKVSLQNYQDSEQRALAAYNGGHLLRQQRPKKKLFKTVALAIIAIQRLKYIGRIWHTGKRIVSKSVFTITQQKRSLAPTINCPAVTSTSPSPPQSAMSNGQHSPHISNTLKVLDRPMAPLKTPTLLNGGSRTPSSAASTTSGTAFEWPVKVTGKTNKKY